MRILDNSHNSGRWDVSKVVGAPRFELGTPCTPCEQSLQPKSLKEHGFPPRDLSRNDVDTAELSPCSGKKLPADSGRIRELLSQPAMLTDRIQPIRRPILRLRKI